jgi:hypothetical protein
MRAGKLVSTGVVGLMGLAGSLAVTVVPANASTTVASGCTVGRFIAAPATHYNGGLAKCSQVTNDARMRAQVHCRNALGSYWVYGPWVYYANDQSRAVCSSLQDDAYEVRPQIQN